ncbi:nucleotidyl transferase AbiEii/AbiGii toxin family protein [Candidatus Peregrinibacteria bacterium]|nr:nucleotidyl transferase AbiEii/AbiGii toxin family protein [Candidatus Peregrinibacteria bacterium]
MLNKEKHQLIMGNILRDIYTDVSIAPLLGLKGGTCAYFFYGLPRFSVDLDFDLFLIDSASQKLVFEKIKTILEKYGKIKDSHIKHSTIFFLLSYGDIDRNVKIEISTRMFAPNIKEHYELKKHLGISMMAAKKDYLFGSKLAALVSRGETAMRDIYDIWYFAKNNWDINAEVIRARTGKSVKKHLKDCIAVIKRVKENELLRGIGELLSEKEKAWVKKHLKDEVIFMIRNYESVLT